MKTKINKENLIDAYAQQLLDGMDMKTMELFVYDTLVENLTNYTEEELITEVNDYYPELLGEDESQEIKNELTQEEVEWLRDNAKPQNP